MYHTVNVQFITFFRKTILHMGEGLILAQITNIEQPTVIFRRSRIQSVQCRDRWSGKCLNKDCWAFQNINGNYCCAKDGLPPKHKILGNFMP